MHSNERGQTKPNGGVFVTNCVTRVRNIPRRAKNQNETYIFSRRLSRARRLLQYYSVGRTQERVFSEGPSAE